MSWNRNDTRYTFQSDATDKRIRLKKLPSVIPNNKKEDIYEALLHLSKQIQFYDSKSRSDGSLQRFYGNSLPLVLASVTGDGIAKSLSDIRNNLQEIGSRWQKGASILRRNRQINFKEFSYQLDYLEHLKNSAIAEQEDIRNLCPSYQNLIKKYESVLNAWIGWDMSSQAKKLSLQLTSLSNTFVKFTSPETKGYWYNDLESAQKHVDELELFWNNLQNECKEILANIISRKSVDPLTTIPLILGELLEEFSEKQSSRVRENLAKYFLENRAGLTKLETVPETIFAEYSWTAGNEIETIQVGETFSSESEDGSRIEIHSPENQPLNDHQILKIADLECSNRVQNTHIEPTHVSLSRSFPSKFRLDNLVHADSWTRSPFSFQLKSTLFNIWGNVVKWEIEFLFNDKLLHEYLSSIFDNQPEIKQSFNEDNELKILESWMAHAFEIQYNGLEEEYTFHKDRTELNLSRNKLDECISMKWEIVLDGDNPEPLPNEKGEIEVAFHLRKEFAFLYRLFSQIPLNKIKIRSKVLELQDLEVYNDFGKIDPTTPFNIFGNKPEIGSKLYLGHPLVFCNSLDNLKINWQWFGLPDHRGGFAEHYSNYDLVENNQDFLVSISALNAGTWYPEEEKQIVPLFANAVTEDPEDQVLSNIRRLNEIDLGKLELNRKQKAIETLREPQKSKYGYLCLELVNPIGAFGHNRYNEHVQKKMGNPKNQSYFAEPYTPNLGNITVEADLEEVIEGKEISKKIKVKGIDQLVLQSDYKPSTTLMPPDLYTSAVYIELDKTSNNAISLYVELPDHLSGQRNEKPRTWEIRINNEWTRISEEQIVRDETFNFETSGIIIIQDLPAIPNDESVWVKIGSADDTVLSERRAIKTQVLRLEVGDTRELSKIFNIQNISIPNHLAEALEQLTPLRVKSILPPTLFNNPTDYLTFQYRLQNRISTFKDLRQFLLAKFPKIQEVLILTHNDGKEEIAAGHVRIVVIPKTDSSKLAAGEWPKLNSRELQTIKQFVQRSSPMGTIYSIENPQYEQIVVKGNVVIEPGMDPREARRLIEKNILNGVLDVTGVMNSGFAFGQAIYSSKILVLVKNLTFVKSVTNFACYTRFDQHLKLPKDFNSLNYIIEPTQVNHILIPSLSHLLDMRVSGRPESDGIGVSNMTLETDFLVDRLNQSFKLEGIGRNKVGMSLRIEEEPKISSRKISSIKL